MSARPRLAVTLGDPRGIGPEIVAKMLRDGRAARTADLVLVGPTGTDVTIDQRVGEWSDGGDDATAGRLAGAAIERAVSMALRGEIDGIVTAPIDKSVLPLAGYTFPGHTEMLAALTGSKVAMMLTSADAESSPGRGGDDRGAVSRNALRVVLATMHIALRDVPRTLTADRIADAAAITRQGLRDWFGVAEPRIALCALNPHAGDHGRFGSEDDDLLAPAARAAGVAGPFPADTVFVRAMRGEFDAVIAPYHDVGMTAIKVAAFGRAVNVTLGLPFPRTSPDHGTALDIARRGVADPSSMIEATLLCASIAARSRAQALRSE
ncbi:MAG TPA: 4-hydroxythreonine-4-phosphate dehydrogenase PdxA [Gemmatimonadaceae bacterium]|nr:4-hydroxythreonine-4-phosphate dehydrogenase PdxA [Gemmatimonadaceae bacterium]